MARDPEIFDASAVADSGRCITEAIEDFAAGRLRPGSTTVHGLAEPDYVRLVVAQPLERLYGERLQDWARRLVAGEVRIETTYDGPEL